MNIRIILTASILGAAIAIGGPAAAGSRDLVPTAAGATAGTTSNIHPTGWRGERRYERRAHRHGYRGHRHRTHRRWERRHERRSARRYYRHERRSARRHYRHYGYRRGHYLPHRRYRVVHDWYDYGWREPHYGERYVYVDGRYFLIQAATGLILFALTR